MSDVEKEILADIDEKIEYLKNVRSRLINADQEIKIIEENYEEKGCDSLCWIFLFVRSGLRKIIEYVEDEIKDKEKFKMQIMMVADSYQYEKER